MEPMKPQKPIVPPPALRAARALLKLSQDKVCQAAQLTDRSLRQAESSNGAGEGVSNKLRQFYEASGLVFLGSVSIGSGRISGCGVRWAEPDEDSFGDADQADSPVEQNELSFRAARAFLGLSMDQVSDMAGLSKKAMIGLEGDGVSSEASTRNRLTDFYESHGLIFLGRRGKAVRQYYGVGIQMGDGSPGNVSHFEPS
jgi:transcriptional regulator with XRE-family HTH domain